MEVQAIEPTDIKQKKSLYARCVTVIAIVFSIVQIIQVVFRPIDITQLRGLHLAFAITITLLTTKNKRLGKAADAVIKCLVIVGVLLSYGYLFRYGTELTNNLGFVKTIEVIFGIIAVSALLYIAVLKIGWVLPSIASVFIAYAFVGPYLPGILAHRGYNLQRVFSMLYMSNDGILGVATDTSARIVAVFVLFGAFINATGAGDVIMDTSMALLGGVRGGPAKIAVGASALFGTISGSAVANVVGTGSITIPLMKKTGYRPEFAGAVEAVASTGGQLMPPIMGSAAFIMAEVLGIPYLSIAASAIIPAILYYLAVFFMIDFEAIKIGLKGRPREELPSFKKAMLDRGYLLLPIIVLLVLMIGPGFSPGYSAFWSIVATVVVAAIKKESRMSVKKILKVLEEGAYMMIEVAVTCGVAGCVIGVLSMTGLGLKVSSLLIGLAGGNMLVLLILTAIVSIILGMGLPTVAVYIVVAAIIGPTLVQFGIPPVAAHMFIFYYGILAVITPPVALASYAAAGIANCPPNKTGWVAVRLGSAGFLLPMVFVYSPVLLLQGAVVDIVIAAITATIGILLLACASSGYPSNNAIVRFVFLAGAVLMIIPGITTDLIGLVLGLVALFIELKILRRRENAGAKSL